MNVKRSLVIACSLSLLTGCAAEVASNSDHKEDFAQGLDNWVIESVPHQDTQIKVNSGQLDIDDAAGTTVWFKESLQAPVCIRFQATLPSSGGNNDRVSDMNVFWMATDPANPDFFANSEVRSGYMRKYDLLKLYYLGYGANNNQTTRFREYQGDGQRPLLPEHDLTARQFMNIADTPMQFRIKSDLDGFKIWRDQVLVFDVKDQTPNTKGYFGFRTWKSHVQLDNFSASPLDKDNCQ